MTRAALESEVLRAADLEPQLCGELFAIYARHYDYADRGRFLDDLAEKDFVILLRDAGTGAARGFSTQRVLGASVDGRPVRALFSGDTIIDRDAWGEQELVRAWCRLAGRVRAAEPRTPLYWFLISKGYRTYLYLPLFYRDFYPRHDRPAPAFEQGLLDALCERKFGEHYDRGAGLIRFPRSLGQLKRDFADVPPKQRSNPHVKFFLARNPDFARGVELACLAEIAADNMRGLAQAMLREGEALGPLACAGTGAADAALAPTAAVQDA